MENLFDFMKSHALQFVSTVPDHLKCNICRNVLIDSRFAQCGCKFCLNCITKYLLDGCKPCPSGREECADVVLNMKVDVTKDPSSDTQISNLAVRCPHANCDHQCRLRALPEHLTICSYRSVECEFAVIGCKERVFGKSDMENHLAKENVGHMRLLLLFLKRIENETRHRIDVIDLRLEEAGKLNEGNDRECRTEKKDLLTLMDEMKNEMDEMKAVGQHTANEMQRIIRINVELEKKIQCQNRTIDEMGKRIREMEMKMKENGENVEKKLGKEITDKIKSMQDEQTRQMQESILVECVRQTGTMERKLLKQIQLAQDPLPNNTFIWKVKKMRVKRREAEKGRDTEIFSEYFDSHPKGYRMRLSLSPNGDDDGKGTHLSLYFNICKGLFDDVLQWPMNKKIRLAIVNQRTDQEHIGYNFSYEIYKDEFSDCYLKPTDRNTGMGETTVISWKELLKNNDLLNNDVLFIKCSFHD